MQHGSGAPSAEAGPRLNLGCGTTAPSGWINVDGSPGARLAAHPVLRWTLRTLGLVRREHADVPWPAGIRILDLRKRLPFPDRSISAVYASHLLEHLHLEEARRLLGECRRILRPGGTLRVVVPDLRSLVREYLGDGRVGPPNADLERVLPGDRLLRRLALRTPEPPRGFLRRLLATGWDFQSHKWMYDVESLSQRVLEAGFAEVTERRFLESRIAGIDQVEQASRVRDGEGIIVEALTPAAP